MELYLLRHGIAEDRSASGEDAHRVLTAAGIKQITHTALAMQTLQISLDVIVASPFYRTRQTADLIGHNYQLTPVVDNRVAPGFDDKNLLHITQQLQKNKALFVGHEPDLSWIVWTLVGQRINVPRAALMRLDSSPRGWQLMYNLAPQAQAALLKYS